MSITYLEAIREAQAHALRDDPRVFIYGQDVARFGGAFKATKNLAGEFPGRVLDSPISEDAIVGLAVGAAIEGMRPIVANAVRRIFPPSVSTRLLTRQQRCFGAPTCRARLRCACPSAALRAAGRSTVNAWKRSTRVMRVDRFQALTVERPAARSAAAWAGAP